MTDQEADNAADRAAERADRADAAYDRVSLRRQPRQMNITIKGWYPIVIIGFVLVMLTLGSVGYSLHLDQKRQASEAKARAAVVEAERRTDRRWCKLLVPLDDSYRTNPAIQNTELGRRVAEAIHQIRQETGC